MIVPELPREIRELKERVGRFVEEEVYPLEQRIAERGSIDYAEVDDRPPQGACSRLRDAEHAAGARGHGPLDARPGRDRGGDREGDERARLRGRRPRAAGAARARDAEQAERSSRPSSGASTARPGRLPSRARDRTSPASGDGDSRRRRLADLTARMVRHERGRPRLLHRARPSPRASRRSSSSSPTRLGSRSSARRASCTTRTSTIIPRSFSATAGCPTRTASPRAATPGAKEWILVERLFIAARCCGAAVRLLDNAT